MQKRRLSSVSRYLIIGLVSVCGGLSAQTRKLSQDHRPNGARMSAFPLPPMGWGSWNSFSNTIDFQIVSARGRAMISTGMSAAGSKYMLIDEGWWLGARGTDGGIIVDANSGLSSPQERSRVTCQYRSLSA